MTLIKCKTCNRFLIPVETTEGLRYIHPSNKCNESDGIVMVEEYPEISKIFESQYGKPTQTLEAEISAFKEEIARLEDKITFQELAFKLQGDTLQDISIANAIIHYKPNIWIKFKKLFKKKGGKKDGTERSFSGDYGI